MRDIKFRAWDKKEKQMEYSDDVEFSASEDIDFDLCELSTFFGWISGENSKDNYELMQFSGLLDKNGKEIYEGDILKTEEGIGDVSFWVQAGRWEIEIGDFSSQLSVLINKETEVIGSIYENPNLIK